MIKLLLDEGLPRSAAALLQASGLQVTHAGDLEDAPLADEDILDIAEREEQTIVTLDSDFHTWLALRRAVAPSVIRIRIEGLRAEGAAEVIRAVLARYDEDLEQGAAVTVEPTRMRMRRLPLVT
jgi:predicted nuclease of predicted toxin-antitoxin system